MRVLLVPTCLVLTAWASTTATSTVSQETGGFSIVAKKPARTNPVHVASAVADGQPQQLGFETPPAHGASARLVSQVAPAETPEQAILLSGDPASGADHSEAVEVPVRPQRSRQEVCDALAAAAAKHDLPTPFFIRLIHQESGFNPTVVSRAGAQGVAQFMPKVAANMGLEDPFDPVQALPKSAELLRELLRTFGNLGLAAAAYNAGPTRIKNWLEKRGKLPDETRNYVQSITGKPAEHWKAEKATAAAVRVPARAPCQREAGLLASNGPKEIPLPPSRIQLAAAGTVVATAAATSNTKAPAGKAGSKPQQVVGKVKVAVLAAKSKAKTGKSKTASTAKKPLRIADAGRK